MFIGWSSTNLYVFCSDMKFKMAATAGPSLTLDPMGKMFQNASSLKPLGQLKPNYIGPYGENVSKRFFSETTRTVETKLSRNDHWKVLYKFSVFYADRKSKMADTA